MCLNFIFLYIYFYLIFSCTFSIFAAAAAAAAAAKSLQLCPTLCDPIDGSPSGSSVHGIFQARVLEWGAIAFSINTSMLLLLLSQFNCVRLCVTP